MSGWGHWNNSNGRDKIEIDYEIEVYKDIDKNLKEYINYIIDKKLKERGINEEDS